MTTVGLAKLHWSDHDNCVMSTGYVINSIKIISLNYLMDEKVSWQGGKNMTVFYFFFQTASQYVEKS